MGGGSGPNSTFCLTDFLGAAAGEPYNSSTTSLNTYIPTITADGSGASDYLGGYDRMNLIFTAIAGLLAGSYDQDDLGSPPEWVQLPNPHFRVWYY